MIEDDVKFSVEAHNRPFNSVCLSVCRNRFSLCLYHFKFYIRNAANCIWCTRIPFSFFKIWFSIRKNNSRRYDLQNSFSRSFNQWNHFNRLINFTDLDWTQIVISNRWPYWLIFNQENKATGNEIEKSLVPDVGTLLPSAPPAQFSVISIKVVKIIQQKRHLPKFKCQSKICNIWCSRIINIFHLLICPHALNFVFIRRLWISEMDNHEYCPSRHVIFSGTRCRPWIAYAANHCYEECANLWRFELLEHLILRV